MLKLYITESNYVTEAITDIKKYYPNIPDDVFMQLIALDPTYRGNDSAGKYGKWLLNLYNKGRLSQDEFNEVPDLLNQFTTYRNRIANKDLNSYKSLDDLSNVLASVIDDDSMLTDRQKVRFLKNVKSGKIKTSAEDDYDVVLETPKFIVYVPNTHEASMKLGKGTSWCTAHENPEWFNKYTKNNGKLYIVKDKKTNKRWQYSDLKGDFLDENDEEFDVLKLLAQDVELSKFFSKFGFFVPEHLEFDEDGYFIYVGGSIDKRLNDYVTKIKIADDVDCIEDGAFYNWSITTVEIPNNIKIIGDSAFCGCNNLTYIVIPNSVIDIENNAFSYCEYLHSVTLSEGLLNIGTSAFEHCDALESITIPSTVKCIGSYAFMDCNSLESVTIREGVKEIEQSAFTDCYSLKTLILPNSIIRIGESAFGSCSELISVELPNNLKQLEDDTFAYCENLQSITIPNSIEYIADTTFDGCDNLTIYTNNDYVIDYCNENNIPTKPLNNNESINKNKRYKLHIKETYELTESNKPNVFNNNSRETYGDLINPNSKVGNVTTHDYYKFEKGKDAKITYMTGEDYIDKCCKYIFKKPRTNVVDASVDFNKVNEYAEMMKNGTTFQGTYLDYTSPTQEGRHRALAFTKAFGDNAKMPVLEIFPTDVTDDEIYDYCQRRWGNGDEWFSYVAYKLGRTEKEVCDYLGIPYNETQPDEDELGNEEDTIDDTDIDFNISDEDILDDEYEMEAFEEFVREQSNGKIQDISDLNVDEFMKWMNKFTRYYS